MLLGDTARAIDAFTKYLDFRTDPDPAEVNNVRVYSTARAPTRAHPTGLTQVRLLRFVAAADASGGVG